MILRSVETGLPGITCFPVEQELGFDETSATSTTV